jgi:hypothetical protein
MELYNNPYDREFFTNQDYKIVGGEAQKWIEKDKLVDREII